MTLSEAKLAHVLSNFVKHSVMCISRAEGLFSSGYFCTPQSFKYAFCKVLIVSTSLGQMTEGSVTVLQHPYILHICTPFNFYSRNIFAEILRNRRNAIFQSELPKISTLFTKIKEMGLLLLLPTIPPLTEAK